MNEKDIKLLEHYNSGMEGDLYLDKKDWKKIQDEIIKIKGGEKDGSD